MIPLLLLFGLWVASRAQATAAAQPGGSAPAVGATLVPVASTPKSNVRFATMQPDPTQGAEPLFWQDAGATTGDPTLQQTLKQPVYFAPSSTLYTALGGGTGGGGHGATGGGGAGGGGGHALR